MLSNSIFHSGAISDYLSLHLLTAFSLSCLHAFCIVVSSSGMWVLIDPLDLALLWLAQVFPGSCILHSIDCRMLKFAEYDLSLILTLTQNRKEKNNCLQTITSSIQHSVFCVLQNSPALYFLFMQVIEPRKNNLFHVKNQVNRLKNDLLFP